MRRPSASSAPTPEILNNQGFSYILRGDYRRARETLLAAQAKDPDNPYIKNNLRCSRRATARARRSISRCQPPTTGGFDHVRRPR